MTADGLFTSQLSCWGDPIFLFCPMLGWASQPARPPPLRHAKGKAEERPSLCLPARLRERLDDTTAQSRFMGRCARALSWLLGAQEDNGYSYPEGAGSILAL